MSEEQSNRELALFELKQSIKALVFLWLFFNVATLCWLLLFDRVDWAIASILLPMIILPYAAWQSWNEIKDIYYNKPGHLYDKPPTQQ